MKLNKFSILIPTFNNLEYLKICLKSLEKNSSNKNHEIIVHINDGSDGTLNYIKSENICYTYSNNNIGLCSAINRASGKATTDFLLYAHDDMYFCPNWDYFLNEEVNQISTTKFYLSGTMIEPNGGHVQFNCGTNYKNFQEDKLLRNLNVLPSIDFQGSHWAPHLIHSDIWKTVGGFSEEFNPGKASDPDLNMKLWKAGVRIFKGIGKFKVYHFSSISLRKKKEVKINNGSKTFLKKWGITTKFFIKYYLRGSDFKNNKISLRKYNGPLSDPKINIIYLKDLLICYFKKKLVMFRMLNKKF